jgi:carbon monoxide dehydrogenase subunit G
VQLENLITVPASPDRVWKYLLETEEVVKCMPGATLTETIDDHTWAGMVSISLGPLTLSYAGVVEMTERDEANRRASLNAKGTETRGSGNASANVTFTVEPGDDGSTKLLATTDLELDGTAAQYGQGMISAVSKQLSKQFARCVAVKLQQASIDTEAQVYREAPTPAAEPEPTTGKPIAGIRLAIKALAAAVGSAVRRLVSRMRRGFGRKP